MEQSLDNNVSSDLTRLSPLVAEYENLVKALKEQIEYYKTEHAEIRQEVQNLIKENNELNLHLKRALSIKTTLNIPNCEEINNLKEQIELITQEKDTAINLWHEAQKQVDCLEEQLNDPKNVDPEIINDYKKTIKELELKLKLTIARYEAEHKDFDKTLQEQRKDLENSFKSNKISLNQIDKLQDEINEFEDKLTCMTKCRDELQIALNSCEEHLLTVESNDMSNLEQINLLKKENDIHISNEKQYSEEIFNLKQTLDEIIEEAGRKVKEESETVANEYTFKLNKMLEEFKELEGKHREKCEQVDKLTLQSKQFEEKLETCRKANHIEEFEEKIKNLETKLDTSLNKLVLSERRNNQITMEAESLRHDMDKMTREYERDIQIREMEMKKLENRILLMRDELNCTNKSFLKAVEDSKMYADQVFILQEELKKIKAKDEMYEKLCAEYTAIDEEKCIKSAFLESHVKVQSNLNQRWQKEVHDIIAKFSNHLTKLVKDNKDLKEINHQLNKELKSSKDIVEEYVLSLKNIQ